MCKRSRKEKKEAAAGGAVAAVVDERQGPPLSSVHLIATHVIGSEQPTCTIVRRDHISFSFRSSDWSASVQAAIVCPPPKMTSA